MASAVNDISKEEILRHIFGEIGELIEGGLIYASTLDYVLINSR